MTPRTDPELFEPFDALLPAVPSMPVLRTVQSRVLTAPNAQQEQLFQQRANRWARVFEMSGDPVLTGDRALLRQGEHSLEVFRTSDSTWWTNHRLTNVEARGASFALPPEQDAMQLTRQHLDRFGFDVREAKPARVTYTESSSAANPDARVRTAMDVNYRFTVQGFPVFGPGAKIKVTLGNDAELAQIAYFWREAEVEGDFAPVAPADAIAIFHDDPVFSRLNSAAGARVYMKSMALGFYAMSPAKFQQFYIPTYAIDAVVDTPTFPNHFVRRYVHARKLTVEESKASRYAAAPEVPSVF